MKLRRTILIVTLTLFAVNATFSQNRNNSSKEPTITQTAVTRDGRIVILKSDGTWEYAKEAQPNTKEDVVRSTLLEVQSDQAGFIEKPVLINAALVIGSSYREGYKDAEATHYAFELTTAGSYHVFFGYVYMTRGEKANELRKKLLAKQVLEGSFTIKILKDRYRKGISIIIAELIDYKVSSDK